MIKALIKADIKNNRFIWILLTGILCLYIVIILSLFNPEQAAGLDEMLKLMPEAIVKAMSFQITGSSLVSFISGYMYGFLMFLFPMILSIIINHRLIASMVDKGSMAYLIATPNSRVKIALTQSFFSILSITAMFAVSTAFTIIAAEIMFEGYMDIGKYLLLNLYTLTMYFAIGSIGFFASCIADDTRTSLGIGAGLPVGFFVLRMLGNAGEKLSLAGKLSIYYFFDPDKAISGDSFYITGMIVFLLIAIVLYSLSVLIFKRKNL